MGAVPSRVPLEYPLSAEFPGQPLVFRQWLLIYCGIEYVQIVADQAKTGLYLDIAPRNLRNGLKFWNFENVNNVRGSDAGVEWIKKRQNRLTMTC